MLRAGVPAVDASVGGSSQDDRTRKQAAVLSAVHGLYCRFSPPADLKSSPQSTSEQLRAHTTAEARVSSLTESLMAMSLSLASQVDPPPSEEALAARNRLEEELKVARDGAHSAQVAVESQALYGYDALNGRARVSQLQGLVPAHPVYDPAHPSAPLTTAVTCTSPVLPEGLAEERHLGQVQLTPNADASALSLPAGSSPAAVSQVALFHYYPRRAVRLQAVHPSGGPTAGNTTVTVYLSSPAGLPRLAADGLLSIESQSSNVRQAANCRFGTAFVAARVRHTRGGVQMVCVSPPVEQHRQLTYPLLADQSREVPLSVSLNGQDRTSGPALRWSYYPLHRVRISQILPFGGPSAGGTLIRVTGALFRPLGGAYCLFGEARTATPATIWAVDELQCASPPLLTTHGDEPGAPALPSLPNGNASIASAFASANVSVVDGLGGSPPAALWRAQEVRVTLNGDYEACSAGVAETKSFAARFWYYDRTLVGTVASVYPVAGPAAGGTWLLVTGASFEDLHQGKGLRCTFGDSGTASRGGQRIAPMTSTPAVLLTSQNAATSVRCQSPPAASIGVREGDLPMRLPISVVMNADTAAVGSTNAYFTYYEE